MGKIALILMAVLPFLVMGDSFMEMKEKYTSEKGYLYQSMVEHSVISFYKNEQRILNPKIFNPDKSIFDKVGCTMATTDKHKVELCVEFNIYGHINLTEIDELYDEIIGDSTKNFPLQIIVIKHPDIISMFGQFAVMAGMHPSGKSFILSEISLTSSSVFMEVLRNVITSYHDGSLKKQQSGRKTPKGIEI
jgi:hypothetical protein